MCTIAWIKTDKGFIMFKNRDRKAEERIDSNFVNKQGCMLTFEDKKFNGCWFGINQYKLAVTHTIGPYRDIPEGFSCENENFDINSLVLKEAKTVEEATGIYKHEFLRKKIGKSYCVIICNNVEARILELALDQVREERFTDSVFRTNSFLLMHDYNKEKQVVTRSNRRLRKAMEMAKDVHSAGDAINILSHHSVDEIENICRHDMSVTVGSVSLELSGDEVSFFHCLNVSPCKGEYQFGKW